MIRVFVEAAAGSRIKGIYDECSLERQGERRALKPYPHAYGFVLGTRTEDGDGVDCYLIGGGQSRGGAHEASRPEEGIRGEGSPGEGYREGSDRRYGEGYREAGEARAGRLGEGSHGGGFEAKAYVEGEIVECEPFGLLEFFEGEERDFKVLAAPLGCPPPPLPPLRDELAAFLVAIFAAYPEVLVRVGSVLSKDEALAYLDFSR